MLFRQFPTFIVTNIVFLLGAFTESHSYSLQNWLWKILTENQSLRHHYPLLYSSYLVIVVTELNMDTGVWFAMMELQFKLEILYWLLYTSL